MRKNDENLIEKLFGSFAVGSSRIPIRGNVYSPGGKGYNPIGITGGKNLFDTNRKSPLIGNATPTNSLSGYYEKVNELKGYQLIDICKLATNFFSDYIVNFLTDDSNSQIVNILNEDGSTDNSASERINQILTKDLRIFDYIKEHIQDYVYFGGYYSMLRYTHDDFGHLKFRIEELNDPIAVVEKKKRNKDNEIESVYLAKGDDNTIYEIPESEIICISTSDLRLVNDLGDDWKEKEKLLKQKPTIGKEKIDNRERVLKKESYLASSPLFYSLIIKLKELIVKELLVSLISLRDLSSIQIFLLQFDKSIPLESANELCARATKLCNNTNELTSFITAQFDIVSFIEQTLTSSAKFIPDYNSTISGKNSMLPLDKLSDKLIDILQTIDQCRSNVISPLGLPISILDSSSGNKWQILQQSERANSKVSGFIVGIKNSVISLVCNIYKLIYGKDLDPSLIKLHISEKTSVEYNNQINQSESISGLLQSITNILQTSLQTLDLASPLIEPNAFITYVFGLIKDIDPNAENLINENTIAMYTQLVLAKVSSQFEQAGMDPSQIQEIMSQSQQLQQK